MRWYEWSLKVLGVKLAIRQGKFDEALAMADDLARTPAFHPARQFRQISRHARRSSPPTASPTPKRASNRAKAVSIRELPGKLGRVPAHSGYGSRTFGPIVGCVPRFRAERERLRAARRAVSGGPQPAGARPPVAATHAAQHERHLEQAAATFRALGAERDLEEVARLRTQIDTAAAPHPPASAVEADDSVIRRLVEASVLSDLLARETATSLVEATQADAAVIFVVPSGGEVRVVATAGCDPGVARALARAAAQGNSAYGEGLLLTEALGRSHEGARFCTVVAAGRLTDSAARRFRMFTAVANRGSSFAARGNAAAIASSRMARARSNRCCPASSARARP
jgi:hypothetical protein